jgi:hypothetical protein
MTTQQLTQDEEDVALQGVMDSLSQELLKVSQTKQNAADILIQDQYAASAPIRVAHASNPAGTNLDDTFASLIKPDEEFKARLPKGSKVTTSVGNTRNFIDPATEEVIVVGKKDTFMEITPPTPQEIVRKEYEAAGKPRTTLNIQEELGRLRQLSGDNLTEAASTLSINIRKAGAEERESLRTEAARVSGLTEAQAAYEMNVARDKAAGGIFTAQMSYQTKQAADAFQAALARANAMEASLVASSPRMAELNGALESIKTVEVKRGLAEEAHDRNVAARRDTEERRQIQRIEILRTQGEMAANEFDRRHAIQQLDTVQKQLFAMEQQARTFEERRAIQERKNGALRAAVSDEMLNNFQLAYGTTGDSIADREKVIAMEKRKDKLITKVLFADSATLTEMIGSTDGRERDLGLKILNGKDILANSSANIPIEELVKRPLEGTAAMLAEVIQRSATVDSAIKYANEIGVYKDEAKKGRTSEVARTTGVKEKESLRRAIVQDTITARLNNAMTNFVRNDVTQWKTNENVGIFKEAIESAKSPGGRVHLADFVRAVATMDVKDENGVLLDRKGKMERIRGMINTATENKPKSLLHNGDKVLALQIVNEAMNNFHWEWALKALSTFETLTTPPAYGIMRGVNRMIYGTKEE